MPGQRNAVLGAPARLGGEEHLLQPLLDGGGEAAPERGGARAVVLPQRRQPGPRIVPPALGEPLDQAGRERLGIGGPHRVAAHHQRLVGEHGNDGGAEELRQVLPVAVVGEAQEAGHRIRVEDVSRRRRAEAAGLLLREHAADVAAAVHLPHAHRRPAPGRHLDAHDVARQRLQHAQRIRVHAAFGGAPAKHRAHMAVAQAAPGDGAPESGERPLHLPLPQAHRPADVVRVLRHHRTTRRPARVAALVVQDHLHAQARRFRHQQPRQPEELVGQVADPARQADPGVQHEAAVVGVTECAQLAQQFALFQVIVQKPERNRPELPRRRLELRECLPQIHSQRIAA